MENEIIEVASELTKIKSDRQNLDVKACGICGADHSPMDCNIIRLVSHIPDKPIPSKARLSLPDDLEIRTMADDSFTVVALYFIEKGMQFGPLQAKKLYTLLPVINFPLKLFYDTGEEFSEYFLDTSNENECNWMMFISAASSFEEQNLICYQHGEDLYYVTVRDILEGEQLKVWYAPHYAVKMQKCLLGPTVQQDHSKSIDQAAVSEVSESLVRTKKNVTQRDSWSCKYCGKVNKNLTEFAVHLVGHYRLKSGRFCQICNSNFRTSKGYQKHKKIVHSEAIPKISEPEKDITQIVQLKAPADNPTGGPLLSNDISDSLDNPSLVLPQNYLSEFGLGDIENQGHLWENENLQLNTELILNDNVKNLDYFNFELKEPDNEQLMCDICLKSFKKLAQLILHMAQHTGRFTCYDCNKVFARKENFQFHACKSYYKIKCTLCDKLFFQKKYLSQHLKQVHNRTYTCKACNNIYDSKENLRNHGCTRKRIPAEKKKTVSCTKCSKQFTLLKNLRVHMRDHEIPKERYTCLICNMVLNSRKSYLRHVKLHEGNAYQCEECPKVFTRKDTLKEHQIKAHFREEATCEICNKVVKSKKLLKHHMEIHKEKNLKCPECPTAFKQKKNLRRHIKVCHIRNKDIQSSFSDTLEKPYSCPKCDKKMKLSLSVKRHIEKFHPEFEYSYETVKCKKARNKVTVSDKGDEDPVLDLKETIENMNFSTDDITCLNTEINIEIDKLLNNPENFSSDTNDILVESLINSVVKDEFNNKSDLFKQKDVFLSMPDLDIDDNMSLGKFDFCDES